MIAEDFNCGQCHAELSPFEFETHRIHRMAQTGMCKFCHVAQVQIQAGN